VRRVRGAAGGGCGAPRAVLASHTAAARRGPAPRVRGRPGRAQLRRARRAV